MYSIAICDSTKEDLLVMKKMLKEYGTKRPEVELQVESFRNAEELLDAVKKDYNPDVTLMEIELSGKNGIQAVKEMRELGSENKVVFVTNSKEYALEAYGVGVAQYQLKPLEKEVLFRMLDKFSETVDGFRQYLLTRVNGRLQRVSLNNAVYCESQGKYQVVHLCDGNTYQLHLTLKHIFKNVSHLPQFVKVGAGYIVNLMYVDSINSQDICFHDGRKIYIPRGMYKTIKEQYYEFYEKRRP